MNELIVGTLMVEYLLSSWEDSEGFIRLSKCGIVQL